MGFAVLTHVQAVYSRYINPALMDSLMHQGAMRDQHDVLSQVGLPTAPGPLPPAMVGYSSRREARAYPPQEPLSQRQPLSQQSMGSFSQVRLDHDTERLI